MHMNDDLMSRNRIQTTEFHNGYPGDHFLGYFDYVTCIRFLSFNAVNLVSRFIESTNTGDCHFSILSAVRDFRDRDFRDFGD